MPSNEIKILIADDHYIFRNGLKSVFNSYLYSHGLVIVGEARNGSEAIKQVEELSPDVVLMDIQMPVLNGIQATVIITEKFPDVAVIALSTFNESHFVLSMFDAGAKGFLLKNTDVDELLTAIKSVHNGDEYITSEVSSQLISSIKFEKRFERNVKPLSDRETMIVQLICNGLCNKEIAARLQLSKRTIDAYREKIMEKTGARNAFDLFSYAVQSGIHKMIVHPGHGGDSKAVSLPG